MTSDTANRNGSMSDDRKKLDVIFSKHQVNLSGFTPTELNSLLHEWLFSLEPRNLRRLTTLRETLSRAGDTPIFVHDPEIELASDFKGSLGLDTQTINAYRGVISGVYTYRRHESDEETTDKDVVHQWGGQEYLFRGKETTLLLRRQPNHTRAFDNLICVTYWYEKEPHREQWIVNRIVAELIDPDSFSQRFGREAPRIATTLIWEIHSILSNSYDDFVRQADFMKRRAEEWGQLASAIYSGN